MEYTEVLKKIGTTIQTERENRKISQDALCELIKEIDPDARIGRNTLSDLENGKTKAKKTSLAALYAIGTALDVDIDFLTGQRPDYKKLESKDVHDYLGISEAAVENLIEINKMCQAASHVSEDILSTILASKNFTALIRAMIDLTFLADDLEEQVTIARAMQGKAEEPAVNLDYLENSIKALRFGRYSVVEPCNAILDELRPATIEDVLKDLNNYRNGK